MTYGHDERVGHARYRVRELVSELDIVVVEPATVDDCDPVEIGHACLCEQTGQEVSDDTANCV